MARNKRKAAYPHLVALRVGRKQLKYLDAAAAALNMSRSTFIRRAVDAEARRVLHERATAHTRNTVGFEAL